MLPVSFYLPETPEHCPLAALPEGQTGLSWELDRELGQKELGPNAASQLEWLFHFKEAHVRTQVSSPLPSGDTQAILRS